MSIYIKNMKMPTNCRACHFKNHDGMWIRCIFTGQNIEPETKRETKASSCPLIKVPQHGRLVDARYIDSENDRFFDMSRASEEFDEHASAYAYSLIANILANAPTIIPEDQES